MRSVAAAVGTGTRRVRGDPREAPTRDMAATRPGYPDPARLCIAFTENVASVAPGLERLTNTWVLVDQ
ncbi:hypothetical protein Pcinc_038334 [Petrolisthes cinctipes]|uniref:Uncharacterized protein n=1 Tax=Petrolisthes cinctipes TaxID=88211 RepID=A0AAE1ELP5_PETCI|nr:hypothetical protein Pcinc_038334 [Petrolisthes cinctipes]